MFYTLNTFGDDKTSGGVHYGQTFQFPVSKFEIYEVRLNLIL